MATDMRLSLDFVDHPKVRKLIRKVGFEGFYSLIKLFSMAGKLYQKGILKGCDDLDIEDFCSWTGNEGDFVKALLSVKLLDKTPEGYAIHDWDKHQPWIYHADVRSEQARKAIEARWEKRKNSKTSTKNTDSIRNEYEQNNDTYTNSNTPLPSPSPIPSPIPKERERPSPFLKPKEFCGTHKNVLLNKDEYTTLCSKFGKDNTRTYINKISEHMQINGREYANHFAAVQKWLREDFESGKVTIPKPPIPTKCDKCGGQLDEGVCHSCNRRVYGEGGTYKFEDIPDPKEIQRLAEKMRSFA